MSNTNQEEVIKFENSTDVDDIEVANHGQSIVACLVDGKLVLWDIKELCQIAIFAEYSSPPKILIKDHYTVLVGSCNGSVSTFDIEHLCSHGRYITFFSDDLYEAMTPFALEHIEYSENDEEIQKFSKITIFPQRLNSLHFYSWSSKDLCLQKAIGYGCPIIRDSKGNSPLFYALSHDSQECADELLNFIIGIKEENEALSVPTLHAIRDDLPMLFKRNVKNLVPLLTRMLKKHELYEWIRLDTTKQLPWVYFSSSKSLNNKKFEGRPFGSRNCFKRIFSKPVLVQYWYSNFGVCVKAGTTGSLKLLTAINQWKDLEVYRTDFVRFLIRWKWKALKWYILIVSIFFWANLVMMICAIFIQEQSYLDACLAMNIVLAAYELPQFIGHPIEYFWSAWNYLDITRLAMIFWWYYLETNSKSEYLVTYFTVLTNFAAGLIFFRNFDTTRFYVRLILLATKDAIAFLIILLYSVLGFGVLFASTDESIDLSSAWKQAFELEVGNFDNSDYSFWQYLYFSFAVLINVILLLNLLVSVLGDTFSKLKEVYEEVDLKEMLQIVIEIESVLHLVRREVGEKKYMQVCTYFESKVTADKGMKEMMEIKDEIKELKREMSDMSKEITKEIKNEMETVMNIKINELRQEMNVRNEQIDMKIDEILKEIRRKGK